MKKILVIEDDITFSKILVGFLQKKGFEPTVCFNGKDGLQTLLASNFQLVLLDYRLPDANGMDIFLEIRLTNPEVPIIIMTGFSDVRAAVKAIKSGAFEYITKPINPDELLMLIGQALESNRNPVRKLVSEGISFPEHVEGKSQLSKQLHEHIRLVAPTNMSVIIEGESGTGKEYIAKNIHQLSERSNEPFIAVDCGALSKELAGSELFGHIKGSFTGAIKDKMGQFETANGGTLFLDEVGNLAYDVQVKLLRALQERTITAIGSNREIKVDVRIITATNEDMAGLVKEGIFREDLYHRLNEFKLKVPALRERDVDLDLFCDFFMGQANTELNRKVAQFSPEVKALFRKYDWPGNLRELRNTIKRAVLLTKGNEITIESLPHEMTEDIGREKQEDLRDLKAVQEFNERDLIEKTLKEVKYNKTKAAKLLNIDRKTLYLKLERYGLDT